MPKPETLVILSPGFPANEADSAWLPPVQVFVRTFKQTYPGLKIIVLSLEYPNKKSTYQWFDAQVIAFGGRSRSGLFRLLNWIRVWQTLRNLNKHHHIVGVLSLWFDECAFIGHYFAKRYHHKHFTWLLGQDAKAANRYFKLIKPCGEQLIALSDFVRNEVYKNYGIMPQHTVTPGIDRSLFGEASQTRDIDILGAGSLINLKQYHLFIAAVKTISRYMPNIRTVICGTGPQKANLLQQIKHYGLQKNIELKDELAHAEVLLLMQRSKTFLHPSAYEGFGVVMLEALYAGAHVVSFVKPMDRCINHHYVVSNTDEMHFKLFELLLDEKLDHSPVMVYPMQNVVKSMMKLFNQSDAAIFSIRPAIAPNERFAL